MEKVLISGGMGLIGQHLGRKLFENGFRVAILSRHNIKGRGADIPVYYWDPERNEIEEEALESCDYIIHLAGVNIGEKRWTKRRKVKITTSRTHPAEFLLEKILERDQKLKAFISASAIGYYGSLTSDRIFNEGDSFANDFLGNVCHHWEQQADKFREAGARVVKFRTGIVLSNKGGALSRLIIPAKIGLGSAIGSGKQYFPWIHIEDLCNIYLCAIQNKKMSGSYNAVAPEHITNKAFLKRLSQTINRPFWLPNIPSFMIKILFGEMSVMLLRGSRISSEKIITAGYKFLFPTLNNALKDLLK